MNMAVRIRQSVFRMLHNSRPEYFTCRQMSAQRNVDIERAARIASRMPKGTWDTHMHVVDPNVFPLSKDAVYRPSPHTINEAKQALDQLGISKMIIVQPSIYGNDNGCTLDGLKHLGPTSGRAVIQFDPDSTSDEQLRDWHSQGVRGVRLNFKSVGAKLEGTSLAALLQKYAQKIRPLGWVLDLYIGMEDIPLLEPIVPDLGDIKICIAHFGHPSDVSLSSAQSIEVLPGLSNLANLLQGHNVWVKLSGAYRLNKDPQHPLVKSLGRWMLRTRPDRCVFATDWPHTRFEHIDVTLYLEELFGWCEAEKVPLQQVLVDNAEELYDARPV